MFCMLSMLEVFIVMLVLLDEVRLEFEVIFVVLVEILFEFAAILAVFVAIPDSLFEINES